MNKYEKNISEVITLDATEDIVYDFLEVVECADKTVGIIANKELIEFAMDEVLALDWINVRRVDIEMDNIEYMLSVDVDGDLVVQPVSNLGDRYFKDIEIAYISMDGDVHQYIIDSCVDRDVEVILFGYEADEDNDDCTCDECKCVCKESEKKPVSDTVKSSYTVNGKPVAKEEFDKKYTEFEDKYMDNIRDMLLRYCDLMDRFTDWQKMLW